MQKAKLSLIAAALLVPAFALSAYAADFVRRCLLGSYPNLAA